MNEKTFNQALCQIIDAMKTLECSHDPQLAAFILRENPLIVKANLNDLVWSLSKGNAHHNDFAMIWEGIYGVLPDVNKAIVAKPTPDALVEAVVKTAESLLIVLGLKPSESEAISEYRKRIIDDYGNLGLSNIVQFRDALDAHKKAVR